MSPHSFRMILANYANESYETGISDWCDLGDLALAN